MPEISYLTPPKDEAQVWPPSGSAWMDFATALAARTAGSEHAGSTSAAGGDGCCNRCAGKLELPRPGATSGCPPPSWPVTPWLNSSPPTAFGCAAAIAHLGHCGGEEGERRGVREQETRQPTLVPTGPHGLTAVNGRAVSVRDHVP